MTYKKAILVLLRDIDNSKILIKSLKYTCERFRFLAKLSAVDLNWTPSSVFSNDFSNILWNFRNGYFVEYLLRGASGQY